MIRLWSINRVLRWTGFRLCVGLPETEEDWTMIGIKFWGWGFVLKGEIT